MNVSLVVSILSFVTAVVAAQFAAKAFFQSRKDAFQSVSQVLLSSKNSFLVAYQSVVNDDTLTTEQRDYLLKEHAYNYCDAFEVACNLYLKKAIDQDLFKSVFKDEIETICNGCGIANLIDNPPSLFEGDVYKNIVKVAQSWGINLEDDKSDSRSYKVITLCGSTRFKDEFMKTQKRLTLEGNIVISVGLFGHSGDSEVWENMNEGTLTATKEMLDDMHKCKIDMADEIFVINVGGYIGDSTRSEIEYAKEHGKPINYLVPINQNQGQ